MSIAEEYATRVDNSNAERMNELLKVFKDKEVTKEVEELIRILITPLEAYRTRKLS